MFKDSGLAKQIAFVTGGGRGIGREAVRQLAAQGADVTFCYRSDQASAEALQDECRAADQTVTDVTVALDRITVDRH